MIATPIAVIDVETTELEPGCIPETKFWGYADTNGYERFERTKDLAKFLKRKDESVLLHHSNFDPTQLLVDKERGLRVINSHNGRLIRCSYEGHLLQNTMSVFPIALVKIFKAFGYSKTSLKNLAKRNYEDCVNGLDCFLKLDALFFKLVGVSPLETGTVAGTTFRAAEKRAGKMPKDLRFLSAYRGGRFEVFSLQEKHAYKYDIHSSYPRSFLEAQETEELWHVKVVTKDWHGPLFDASMTDMLGFPNGRFSSWVFKSNWERYLEPYVEQTSLKILSRHKLKFKWIVALKELVQTIYALKRDTKDEGIRLCCKFLLNAFYGRIGLKPESERVRIMEYEPDGDGVTSFRLGRKLWLVFDAVEREVRSNYGFAAFITDNARARLYRGFKRNLPMYGATDSIFSVLGRSEFNEPQGNQCGDWAFEGFKRFRALNVGDYEWGDEVVVKGGRPGSEFLTWTMKTFAEGQGVVATTRERRTDLRKRIVLPDGGTMPLIVNH